MTSFSCSSRLFLGLCWLALLCTAAMLVAPPDLPVAGSQARRIALTAIAGDSGTTLPPLAPATGPESDDFTVAEAARPFCLSLVLRSVDVEVHEPAPSYSHSPTIAGERGPPRRA
jgi:hypothetical protein